MPPLSVASLREFAEQFVREQALLLIFTDYVAVMLNSEICAILLAAVPLQSPAVAAAQMHAHRGTLPCSVR